MFPWESAFTGEEACPVQARTGKYEQHITGDIAVALRQYYYATGDDDWAVSRALPMMHGIAQFWVSRAVLGKNPGWWDINGVTPPDEFAVNINNSAYTNAVAALSLEFANELVSKFGRDPDPRWLEVAQGLRSSIPYDTKSGITLEFQSYHGQRCSMAAGLFPKKRPSYHAAFLSVPSPLHSSPEREAAAAVSSDAITTAR